MSIMFIDRDFELKILQERFKSKKAEFIVFYGRRRIGKTELIKEFCKDKEYVYYLADKSNHLEQMEKIVSKTAGLFNERAPLIKDWEGFFDYLKEKSKKRLVFVIDEFPYLMKSYKPILSIFQKGWDEYLKDSNIFLIFCGSSISMMEKGVLSYKSPLYGRRTGQLKIDPLSFKDSLKFFSNLSLEKGIEFFSITGGVPLYLLELRENKNLTESVKENILRKDKILFKEPEFLLKEELRDPTTYSNIFEKIASGAKRLNEIATKTNIEVHKISKYINILVKLNFIERITPVTVKKAKSKNTIYIIKDNFFDFWYRFLYPLKSELEINDLPVFLSDFKEKFNSFVGRKFEGICREYMIELNKTGKFFFSFQKIGIWWGHYRDEEGRKKVEIDICALNENTKEIFFGECKWKNEVNAEKIAKELNEKTKHVDWMRKEGRLSVRKEYLAVFAKSFSKRINEIEGKKVYCFDLEDMEKIFS